MGLKGLLSAGLLAMSISTVESFLNCNSVVFTNDIIPFFCKMFSKKTYSPSVFTARIATVFFCCLGVYISLHFTDLFSIFIVFSNFYYPIAIIPYFILILGLNIKKASIMSGVFCGMAATLINYLITKDPNSYFLGMIAHLVGLCLTELFLRMRNKNDDKDTVTSKV
jgi:SSS family solute:Na+ symporter